MADKRNQKLFVVIFIVVVCIGGVYVIKKRIESSRNKEFSATLARVKGSKEATIKVVEFMDFECPACARGAKTLKDFISQYPKLISVEAKYYPLIRNHKHALMTARYAQCAARQNKFWPVHDLLFERQDQWAPLINATSAFDMIAKDSGVDKVKLDACLKDETLDQEILKDREEGTSRGVNSTPTYFINSEIVVGPTELVKKMNELLGLSASAEQKPATTSP